jgi:hypothetical protein
VPVLFALKQLIQSPLHASYRDVSATGLHSLTITHVNEDSEFENFRDVNSRGFSSTFLHKQFIDVGKPYALRMRKMSRIPDTEGSIREFWPVRAIEHLALRAEDLAEKINLFDFVARALRSR